MKKICLKQTNVWLLIEHPTPQKCFAQIWNLNYYFLTPSPPHINWFLPYIYGVFFILGITLSLPLMECLMWKLTLQQPETSLLTDTNRTSAFDMSMFVILAGTGILHFISRYLSKHKTWIYGCDRDTGQLPLWELSFINR